MQNQIDAIGTLFLNQVKTQSEKCADFSKMILQKMSEFQFPVDNSPEHWNKLMGQEINFMIK